MSSTNTLSFYLAGVVNPVTLVVPSAEANAVLSTFLSVWPSSPNDAFVNIPNVALNWTQIVLVTVT